MRTEAEALHKMKRRKKRKREKQAKDGGEDVAEDGMQDEATSAADELGAFQVSGNACITELLHVQTYVCSVSLMSCNSSL